MADTTKMSPKVEENRLHRDCNINPRKWPHGTNRVPEEYRSQEMADVVHTTRGLAMLGNLERELIYHIPFLAGPGDYANLGHALGGSAMLFSTSLSNRNMSGTVESVDLFDNGVEHRRAMRRLADHPKLNLRVELRTGSTIEWGNRFYNESRTFRAVFIDADHCYEAVKADFEVWSRLIGEAGYAIFHDSHQDFSHRAIDDSVAKDAGFKEVTDLHVETARVFVRQ